MNAFQNDLSDCSTLPVGFEDEYYEADPTNARDVHILLHQAPAEHMLSTFFAPRTFGTISTMHTAHIYMHGMSHEDSILLGRLFALDLDAAKAGKTIRHEQLSKLKSMFRITKILFRVQLISLHRILLSIS